MLSISSAYRYPKFRIVPTQYSCGTCKKRFEKLDSLKRHHRDKHGARITCEFCPYSVARSRGKEMERHMATKHSFPIPVKTAGTNFFNDLVAGPSTTLNSQDNQNEDDFMLKTPTTDNIEIGMEDESVDVTDKTTEESLQVFDGTERECETEEGSEDTERQGVTAESADVTDGTERQGMTAEVTDGTERECETEESCEMPVIGVETSEVIDDGRKNEVGVSVTDDSEWEDLDSKKDRDERRTKEVMEEIIKLMDQQVRFKRKGSSKKGKKPVRVSKERANDRFANDPNYFFLGAPSVYEGGEVAGVLNGAKERALQAGVANPKVKFIPSNLLCIQRVEEATLPDGTKYSLSSFWIEKPVCQKS